MSAPLEARNACFAIGPTALISDLSLRLEPGRVSVIVGPNGAGKSTLMRLLSGELRPDSGSVLCEGECIATIPGWRLACLRAVLPQASRLSFPFTVREVVRIGLDGIGRGLDRSAREALLLEALELANITHLAARPYQRLSGGEQQRTQFARVLAQLSAGRTVAPRQALLLDEPTASLDLKHQIALLDQAAALARGGLAVLAILHDLNLAAAYADELIVLSAGRLVDSGPPSTVLTDALVRDVFGIDLHVGAVPPAGRPFLLPRGPYA
jgi:iron complex transport system ATP-binding protein